MIANNERKKFLVTTPIYYANGPLHIGHMYTACIADLYARMMRVAWYDVLFSTWSDENGQKMLQSAEKAWKDYITYVDDIAALQKESLDAMQISYDEFIRTSSQEHAGVVQELIQQSYDAGDIKKWFYEWMYCIWCESFKKESDLVELEWTLVCPDHRVPPQQIKEENRFFQLPSFQKRLEEFYTNNPWFVYPETKFKEVHSFVEQELEAFSVSRPLANVWIPVPFDPQSVVYIRFDALINYYTVSKRRWDMWREDAQIVHCVGKDISRFHCIYRPAMLMSLWLKLPDQVVVNWFFTIDGLKIGKSLWNGIDPATIVEQSSRDAVVYTFFSDIKIGNDGDFSLERCMETHESILKKWWWNLVSRVHRMLNKYQAYDVVVDDEILSLVNEFIPAHTLWEAVLWKHTVSEAINAYASPSKFRDYCRDWYSLVQAWNKIMDELQPWITVKSDVKKGVKQLHLLAWLTKQIWLLWSPLLVDSCKNYTEILQSNLQWRNSINTTTQEWVVSIDSIFAADQYTLTSITSWHLY